MVSLFLIRFIKSGSKLESLSLGISKYREVDLEIPSDRDSWKDNLNLYLKFNNSERK